MQLFIGFIIASVIAFVSWKVEALSRSGALAAIVVGTVIIGVGGWAWGALLMFFFVSSSAFSKLFQARKSSLNEKFSKGSRRDASQVMANGGIACAFVLLHFLLPQREWIWAAYAASLAAVNADTWATELGVLSHSSPLLITTLKPVEHGTSGGISLFGTLSAVAGGLVIAIPAVVLWQGDDHTFSFLLVQLVLITVCGTVGSLIDSLLGATVQVIYTCISCQKETERHPYHLCGSETTYKRGWRWLDNDWVNLACGLSAGILYCLLWFIQGS